MRLILARSSFRYSLRHPWQLSLSLLGVALGVAVVVSIDLSASSANRAFQASNRSVLGATTHQVLGASSGLDERIYAAVRKLAKPGSAAPVVEGEAAIEGFGGRAFTILGVDVFAESPVRSYLSSVDRSMGSDLGRLLSESNTAMLSRATASALGIAYNDTFELTTNGRTQSMRLVGIVAATDALRVETTAHLVMVDIATAQELLGKRGRLSRIDLVLPDSGGDAGVAKITAALPAGVQLVEAASRTQATLEMTRAFRLNLLMLSLLALLVGMFLIYNTMSFSVVQRQALIGNLRTLGVTASQIFVLIVGEALVLGFAGALLGLVLGVGLATELVKLVARTINDLYFTLEVTEVSIAPALLAKGVLLGTATSVVAACVPAFEATRVVPRVAQLRSTAESRMVTLAPRIATLGAAIIVVSIASLAIPSTHLAPAFAALFGVVLGFTLVTPLLAIGFVALARPVARRLSASLGPLTVRGVSSSLSRTAVAIAALMVALATTVGVNVMVESFRQSLADWLRTTLQADVYVTVPGPGETLIDPRIIDAIRRLPGVVEVSMGRRVSVQSPTGPIEVRVISMASDSYRGFRFVEGEPGRAWPGFDQRGQILVTEPYAWHQRTRVGDTVALETDRGLHAFEVVGVVRDYGSERGSVFMSRATFDRWWRDAGVSTVGIYASDTVNTGDLVAGVERAAAGLHNVYVRSNRNIRRASMEVFERTFTITAVLRILATAVAFVGVLSALMAIQLERRREIAVLRALGMTRGQVWNVITIQTTLMGLLAGLLCVPLGLAMAVMLTDVINRRSFGWSIDLHVEPTMLVHAVLLAVLAALLAGIYPAVRMTSSRPALALREEL